MRKITGIIFAAAILLVGFTIETNAQGRVNNRQRYQQKRIVQGVKTRQLTAQEIYRLQRRQIAINRTEARFRKSGRGLTWRERYILEQRQDRASRSIYRQKHDKQNYIRNRRRY